MVGEPERRRRLVEDIAAVFDAQLRQNPDLAGQCNACGACCDFAAYDHRLFVTPPELIYLAAKLNTETLKAATSGRCPYQRGKNCTVHDHRFAGCRIFCCNGDPVFQGELSEATLKRLKAIGERFRVPYRYGELRSALGSFTADTCRSAGAPCPADRAE
jgi:hypothetical protein